MGPVDGTAGEPEAAVPDHRATNQRPARLRQMRAEVNEDSQGFHPGSVDASYSTSKRVLFSAGPGSVAGSEWGTSVGGSHPQS